MLLLLNLSSLDPARDDIETAFDTAPTSDTKFEIITESTTAYRGEMPLFSPVRNKRPYQSKQRKDKQCKRKMRDSELLRHTAMQQGIPEYRGEYNPEDAHQIGDAFFRHPAAR